MLLPYNRDGIGSVVTDGSCGHTCLVHVTSFVIMKLAVCICSRFDTDVSTLHVPFMCTLIFEIVVRSKLAAFDLTMFLSLYM
jgi:hypothetical protein